MARIRRSVWVAAAICGVVFTSLMMFLRRQGRDEEVWGTEQMKDTLVAEGTETLGGNGAIERIQVTDETIASDQENVPDFGPRLTGIRVPRLPAKMRLELSPDPPRLGETAKLTFTLTTLEDERKLKVWFRPLMGVVIVGGDEEVYSSMSKGETRTFSIDVQLVGSPIHVAAYAGRPWRAKTGEEKVGWRTGGNLYRVIVDEETGQFGTVAEYLDRVEFRYHPGTADWEPEPHEGLGPKNREIIEAFRKFEPALTDSEALCLHYDFYNTPYLYWAPLEEGKEKLTDEDVARYLLEQGWLRKHREGRKAKERWLKALSERNRKLQEELQKKSDREKGKSGSLLPEDSDSKVLVTFDGRWRFRKHLYDTTGLQTEAMTKDVTCAKARVLVIFATDGFHRYYSDYAPTNEIGEYAVQCTVATGGYNYFALPVVFPSGPDPGNARINVSDPNITIPDYWKDPNDPSLFPLRQDGYGNSHSFNPADSSTWHLGIAFPDSFRPPNMKQPESGAANIYEALLQGYEYLVPTYTSPGEIGRVRALWEPGYIPPLDTISYYSSGDTILVLGLDSVDTDEWDDGVLIHEYGHHVQNHCAQIPPTSTSPHDWWRSYPLDQPLAYGQGWPYLLASVVTDSVWLVDTKKGIGADTAFYRSIEDPWLCSAVSPDSFEGGPWCEGAVAGVLWDIYDSADELPYPSYPAPGWPDTNLADTLSLGLDRTLLWKPEPLRGLTEPWKGSVVLN